MGEWTITIRGNGIGPAVELAQLANEFVAKLRASGATIHTARLCTPDDAESIARPKEAPDAVP